MNDASARCRALPVRHDRQCQRGDHKQRSRNRRSLREYSCRAARAKDGLRTHTTERSGEVCSLPALKQNNNNKKETDYDVQRRYQVHHCQKSV